MQIVGEATYAAHEALANGNSDGKYESAPTENKDNSGLLADLSGNRIVYITSRPQLLSKPTGKVQLCLSPLSSKKAGDVELTLCVYLAGVV